MTRTNSNLVDLFDATSDLYPVKSKSVMLELEDHLAEALDRLGDHISHMYREDFLCQVTSLLLFTLISDDADGAIDGFERLVTNCWQMNDEPSSSKMEPGKSTLQETQNKLWGEYMSLKAVFMRWFKRHGDMKADLEELITGDFRVFPEEIYRIKFSDSRRYIMVT